MNTATWHEVGGGLERGSVPGGWIYRSIWSSEREYGIIFVPNPPLWPTTGAPPLPPHDDIPNVVYGHR